MKFLIEKIIQKKNPAFKFDSGISNRILFLLVREKFMALLRGVIFHLFNVRMPNLIFLGPNVSFFNFGNIFLGRWVKIDKGVYLGGMGRGKLTIGRGSGIGAYSQIIISTSFNNLGEYITIGSNVGIGQFASIGGSGGTTIGNNCIIGQYFSCHPENHVFEDLDVLIKNQGTKRAAINVGENCWIGAKVTVLAGVEIGANCVVAAGSVITKSMPANSIIAGVPAKVLRTR